MSNFSVLNCPAAYDKTSFFDILSLSAGYTLLCQNRLGERIIGENNCAVNPKEGIIRFGEREFPAEILGYVSSYRNTWLWSWAHTESGLPEKIAADSRRIKRTAPDLPEFRTGKFSLDELHSGHNIAMAACGISEQRMCYYRFPAEGTDVFFTIHNLPDDIFTPPTASEFISQYMEIVGGLYCDHRLLAAGFLYKSGIEFECSDSEITAKFGGESVTLRFDNSFEAPRIADISRR